MVSAAALSPLFTDIRISADEALVIAGALRDIAEVDGTHPEEEALIDELVREMASDLGDALKIPRVTPADVAQKLIDPTLRTVLLQSALLLAMADGVISDAERRRIREYATALGIAGNEYAEIEHVIEGWVRSGESQPLFA